MVLIRYLSHTLLEYLINCLPEVYCEAILSVMCHKKDTELFNALKYPLKYPIGKYIAEFYWLR